MTTTSGKGVEWLITDAEENGAKEDRVWPVLRASAADPCDGTNPATGRICTLGHHNGYHRDATGAEWLED